MGERASHFRTSRRAILVIGSVLVLLIIGALIFRAHRAEPRYQGRKLALWLTDLEPRRLTNTVQINQYMARRKAATRALEQIGTNAIPYLIQDLRRRDVPGVKLLARWVPRPTLARFRLIATVERQAAAAWALARFGPASSAAVPHLIHALETGSDVNLRSSAAWALNRIGPAALAAVPTLTRVAMPKSS